MPARSLENLTARYGGHRSDPQKKGLADRTAWRRASRRTPEPSFAEFFPI